MAIALETAAAKLFYSHLGKRQNITPAIDYLRDEPLLLRSLMLETTQAINMINASRPGDYDATFAVNTSIVLEKLADPARQRFLPPVQNLFRRSFLTLRAYNVMNSWMKRGEETRQVEPRLYWHIKLKDEPNVTATALFLELYGTYAAIRAFGDKPTADNKVLKTDGYYIVTAIEEIIAMHRNDSIVLKQVERWLYERYGFSENMVLHMQGKFFSKNYEIPTGTGNKTYD